MEKIRRTNQRLTSLQHETRQPRLAKDADVEPDSMNHKRTEGAAAGDRAKHGDSSSARVDDGVTSLTSFGMIVEPILKAIAK